MAHSAILNEHIGEVVTSQGIEYHSRITCTPLPANVKLYMPNTLGKPYYLDPMALNSFITEKTRELKEGDVFSEKIASGLKKSENHQVQNMVKLLDQCDRELADRYDEGGQPLPEQRAMTLKVQHTIESKVGIEWCELKEYIDQKTYIIPDNDEKHQNFGFIVFVQADDGEIRRYDSNTDVITGGKYTLMELLESLKKSKGLDLKLHPSDQISFLDFGCNEPVFKKTPDDIRFTYHWNLLSYISDRDGATMTYGTILLDEYNQQCRDAHRPRFGVSFDDSPSSQLRLESMSSLEPQSPPPTPPPSPSPDRPPPIVLCVRVPPGLCPLIQFPKEDRPRSRSPPNDGAAAAGAGAAAQHPTSSKGGKRKHTKRKRSIKRSYRKRRVTRRKYNSRRYNKNKK